MGPVSTAMGEIYQYTLESTQPVLPEDLDDFLARARTVQDWTLSPLLKGIPGVNEVNSFGGYIKQYHVIVDPEKLLAYDLTLGEVGDSLKKNNLNVGGNILERGERQYLVRGIGLLQTVEDIGAVVLKTVQGTPVLLRDVAEIGIGHAVRQGGAVQDGKGEVVGGVVMMLRGANGREVVRAVERRVAEINASGVLPDGLRIVPYYNRNEIIDRAIGTVSEALLIGSLLVVFILYFFLRSFRGAFIVILALPLSILFTFILMRLFGVSANLMSLGGLAISIGMIIDATIIQVENVQRHLGEKGAGERKLSTVLKAVLEVRKPSIFGELIIALTFIPIICPPGDRGQDVPAPGLHPHHRAHRFPAAVDRGHPGILLSLAQAPRRQGKLPRRACQAGLPAGAALGAAPQGRHHHGLGGTARRGAAARAETWDRVHAHHGRGRLRCGYPVPSGHLPVQGPWS